MPKRTKDFHSWLIKRLTDPREAERYLKVAKADSPAMFFKALRNVAEAKKIAKVAEEAGVNRESLYKALSEGGNPGFYTVESVLNTLGMTLTVQLKQTVSIQSTPSRQSGGQTISAESQSRCELAGAWTTTTNMFMSSAASDVDALFAQESITEQIPADVPAVPPYVAAAGLEQEMQAAGQG
jgi:probable addiction module antidote protein